MQRCKDESKTKTTKALTFPCMDNDKSRTSMQASKLFKKDKKRKKEREKERKKAEIK